jgi:hypothetical protein
MNPDDIPFCGNGIIWPGLGPRPGRLVSHVSMLGAVSVLLPAIMPGAFFATSPIG